MKKKRKKLINKRIIIIFSFHSLEYLFPGCSATWTLSCAINSWSIPSDFKLRIAQMKLF